MKTTILTFVIGLLAGICTGGLSVLLLEWLLKTPEWVEAVPMYYKEI